jgi:chromosome segregation ATPase
MIANIVQLNKQLSAIRLEKEGADKTNADLHAKIKQLEDDKAKLESKLKDLESNNEDLKKQEVAKVIETSESVNKKVVQNLAALGVAEGTVKDTVQDALSITDTYKKYESLVGKDKIEFFQKNERAILKAMKQIHVVDNPLAKAGVNTRF